MFHKIFQLTQKIHNNNKVLEILKTLLIELAADSESVSILFDLAENKKKIGNLNAEMIFNEYQLAEIYIKVIFTKNVLKNQKEYCLNHFKKKKKNAKKKIYFLFKICTS